MELVVIAGLSLIDIWAAVVPAVAMKVDPLAAAAIIGLGSSVGVLLTIGLSARFRGWITARAGRDTFIGGRTDRFMSRYGTRGLGLMSPMVLGPVLTCAGAMALGANPRQLAKWGLLGVWLWAAAAYAVLALGYGEQVVQVAR